MFCSLLPESRNSKRSGGSECCQINGLQYCHFGRYFRLVGPLSPNHFIGRRKKAKRTLQRFCNSHPAGKLRTSPQGFVSIRCDVPPTPPRCRPPRRRRGRRRPSSSVRDRGIEEVCWDGGGK